MSDNLSVKRDAEQQEQKERAETRWNFVYEMLEDIDDALDDSHECVNLLYAVVESEYEWRGINGSKERLKNVSKILVERLQIAIGRVLELKKRS